MKIKVGDYVKFLNDVGGGKVTKILNNKTVQVLNQDDFEVPCLINELILVENDDKYADKHDENESKKEQTKKTENKQTIQPVIETEDEEEIDDYQKPTDDINVFIAFLPVDQNKLSESDLEVYLINDSNYYVMYNYLLKYENRVYNITGTIEPNIKDCIEVYKRENIKEQIDLVVQMMFYKKSLFELRPPVQKEISINPVKLSQDRMYKENDFFDEKVFVIKLFEENMMSQAIASLSSFNLQKVVNDKEVKNKRLNSQKTFKPKKDLNIEYDLHIHELVDDEAGLTPAEILEIQMTHFRTAMEKAIKEHVNRITFIHGIGNGTLKLEIRKELNSTYKKYKYQDASFQEYGYGATLVILKS